jgi:hypothetical protein
MRCLAQVYVVFPGLALVGSIRNLDSDLSHNFPADSP